MTSHASSDGTEQDLGRKVRELERELTAARRQQLATSEILRVVLSSRDSAQVVFDTIARSAVGLCEAAYAMVFRFDGVGRADGPNYTAARATVSVSRNGKPVTVMYPERRVYTVQEQVMTEAAIDPGVTRDLYVSLGDPLGGDGTWLLKVQHKPFVDWIWGGCVLMALGGLLAASDRRYRATQRERSSAETTPLATPAR